MVLFHHAIYKLGFLFEQCVTVAWRIDFSLILDVLITLIMSTRFEKINYELNEHASTSFGHQHLQVFTILWKYIHIYVVSNVK